MTPHDRPSELPDQPDDWTEPSGQLTPSLKLKRNVVQKECADEIAGLYAGGRD